MECSECGFKNREGVKHCTRCGTELQVFCAECKSPARVGDLFCGECGKQLSAKSDTYGILHKKSPSCDRNDALFDKNKVDVVQDAPESAGRFKCDVKDQTVKTAIAVELTEIGPLNRSIENLLNGAGHTLFLIADDDIGKSRVLYEAKTHPEREKFRIIEGRCRSFNTSLSYFVFSEIIRTLLYMDVCYPDDNIEERIAQYLTLEGENDILTPETLIFIANIMRIGVSKKCDVPLNQIENKEIGTAIFNAILRLIEGLSLKEPILFIFDDLHYTDKASAEILSGLFYHIKNMPVMFLMFMNSQTNHHAAGLPLAAHRALNDQNGEIVFNRLSQTECDGRVHSLLQAAKIPDEVLFGVRTLSDGNPIYIEEIVKSLLEEGIVKRDSSGEVFVAKDISIFTIHDSVKRIIMFSIEKLQGEFSEFLMTASVVGKAFEYDFINRVTDLEGIEEIIEGLAERGLIYKSGSFPVIEYSFRNVLIREAIYSSLPDQKLKELHARIAKAAEVYYADNIDDHYEAVAHHYRRADDLARAYEYLFKAGIQAKEAYANRDAVQYFFQSLELLKEFESPPVPPEDVYIALSEVQELLGELERAIDSQTRAMELVGDDLKKGDTMRNIGRLYEKRGMKDKTMKVFEHAGELLKDHNDSLEMGLLMMNQSWILNRMKRFDEAVKKINDSLEIFQNHDAKEHIAQAYNNLAVFLEHQWLLDSSLEYNLKSLSMFTELGNRRKAADVYLSLGYLENKRNNLDTALGYFDKAFDIMESIGNRYGAGTALMSKGRCLIDLGRLEEAEQTLLMSAMIHKELNLDKKVVDNELALSKVYMEKRENAVAMNHLKGARELSVENDYKTSLAKIALMEARILIKEGKGPEEKFQEAIAIYKSLGRDREAAKVSEELEWISGMSF